MLLLLMFLPRSSLYILPSEITTVSYDVPVSTPSTLTCSVSGVSATEVDFVWLDNSGKEYNDVNDKTYSFV